MSRKLVDSPRTPSPVHPTRRSPVRVDADVRTSPHGAAAPVYRSATPATSPPTARVKSPGARSDGAATPNLSVLRAALDQLVHQLRAAESPWLAPWMPRDADEAAVRALVDGCTHSASGTVHAFLPVLDALGLTRKGRAARRAADADPATSVSQRDLYEAHGVLRLLSACLSHHWRACQRMGARAGASPALPTMWRDPPPLDEDATERLLAVVLAVMNRLLTREHIDAVSATADAHVAEAEPRGGARFARPWSRDADTGARDYDADYVLHDAAVGVHSAHTFFTLRTQFPPAPPPLCVTADGLVAVRERGNVTAAAVYHALADVVLYLSSSNGDAVLAVSCAALAHASAVDDARSVAELRVLECANLRWTRIHALAVHMSASVPGVARRAVFPVVCVMLRRCVQQWGHMHADEVSALMRTPGANSELVGLFEALYAQADSTRRRTIVWPTLGALLPLCVDVAPAAARTRRDMPAAHRAALVDTLAHQLGNTRVGLAAAYAMSLTCEVAACVVPGVAPVRQVVAAVQEPLCARATDPRVSRAEKRVLAHAAAALVHLQHRRTVLDLVHAVLQSRQSQGVSMVVHLLARLLDDRLLFPADAACAWLCAATAEPLREYLCASVYAWGGRGGTADGSGGVIGVGDARAGGASVPASPVHPGFPRPPTPSTHTVDTVCALLALAAREPAILTTGLAADAIDARVLTAPEDAPADAVSRLVASLVHVPSTPEVARAHTAAHAVLETLAVSAGPLQHAVRALLDGAHEPIAHEAARRVLHADSADALRDALRVLHRAVRRARDAVELTPVFAAALRALAAADADVHAHVAELLAALPPEPDRASTDALRALAAPLCVPAGAAAEPRVDSACTAVAARDAPWAPATYLWTSLAPAWHTDMDPCVTQLLAAATAHAPADDAGRVRKFVRRLAESAGAAPRSHAAALAALPDELAAGAVQDVRVPPDAAGAWLAFARAFAARWRAAPRAPRPLAHVLAERVAAAAAGVGDAARLCGAAAALAPWCDERARGCLLRVVAPCARAADAGACAPALHALDALTRDGVPYAPAGLTQRHALQLLTRVLQCGARGSQAERATAVRVAARILGARGVAPGAAVLALAQRGDVHVDAVRAAAQWVRCAGGGAAAYAAGAPAHVPDAPAPGPVLASAPRLSAALGCALCATAALKDAPALEQAFAGALRADPEQHCALVCALTEEEMNQCVSEDMVLRANTVRVAVISGYARRTGVLLVQRVLRAVVARVEALPADAFETDPARVPDALQRAARREELQRTLAWLGGMLVESMSAVSPGLRNLCAHLHAAAELRFLGAGPRAVTALLLVRLLGPALVMPESAGVAVSARAGMRRDLLLLSKALVALAQGGFPAHREAHLRELNPFLADCARRLLAAVGGGAGAGRTAGGACLLGGDLFPGGHLPGGVLPVDVPALPHLPRADADVLRAALGAREDVDADAALLRAALSDTRAEDGADALGGPGGPPRWGPDPGASPPPPGMHPIAHVHVADDRRTLVYTPAQTPPHADWDQVQAHVLQLLRDTPAPYSVLVDATGAGSTHLPPAHRLAHVATALRAEPAEIVVLNAGLAVREYLRAWRDDTEPAAADAGALRAPVRFTTAAADAAVRAVQPRGARLLAAEPSLAVPHVAFSDGVLPPLTGVLCVAAGHLVARTAVCVPLVRGVRGETCDVFPLRDVWIEAHADAVYIARRSVPAVVVVHTAQAGDLADALREAAAADRTPLLRAPMGADAATRPALTAAALWFASLPDARARTPGLDLLAALARPHAPSAPVYPYAPLSAACMPPLAARDAASTVSLLLCLAEGAADGGSSHGPPEAPRPPDMALAAPLMPALAGLLRDRARDARALVVRVLADALVLAAAQPCVRGSVHVGVWSAVQATPALTDAFVDACVAVAPPRDTPLLHAALAAGAAATSRALLGKVLARLRRELRSAHGAWRHVHTLTHMLAVQCRAPGAPLAAYAGDIAYVVLVLAQSWSPWMNTGVYALLQCLARDSEPELVAAHTLVPLGEAAVPPPVALQPLVALVRAALLALPDHGAPAHARVLGLVTASAITPPARAPARASPAALTQARALVVLGALTDAVDDDLLYQVLVVLTRTLDAPALALDAAPVAQCLARLVRRVDAGAYFLPHLFWVGVALCECGGGAVLCAGAELLTEAIGALLRAGAPLPERVMLARVRYAPIADAVDMLAGVHVDRNMGFAVAALLRPALLHTDAAARGAARACALAVLAATAAPGVVHTLAANQVGVFLALYWAEPACLGMLLDVVHASADMRAAWAAAPSVLPPLGTDAVMVMAAALAMSLLSVARGATLHAVTAFLVHCSDVRAAALAVVYEPLLPRIYACMPDPAYAAELGAFQRLVRLAERDLFAATVRTVASQGGTAPILRHLGAVRLLQPVTWPPPLIAEPGACAALLHAIAEGSLE
ncbi:hypothetical protein MSPP1_001411 [Malassezia sp. CBS 17886]|nr:hypothetical protein MSPP1_001411 [Malassezia sp. CBS 17886]